MYSFLVSVPMSNSNGVCFSNIKFKDKGESYTFFEDSQFISWFNDTYKSIESMKDIGMFTDDEEIKYILNTLKNRKDIVIVAKGDEDYDIVSKEDYQEYYEKNIKSTAPEEEWSEEAKEIRDHLLNTVKHNKTKKWYEFWKK